MGGLRLFEKRVYVCGLKKFYVCGRCYVCGWFYVSGKIGFTFVVKFYVCGWFTFVGVTYATARWRNGQGFVPDICPGCTVTG